MDQVTGCLFTELESPPSPVSPFPLPDQVEKQSSIAEETERRLDSLDQRIAVAQRRADLKRQSKAVSTAAGMNLAGRPLFQLGLLPNKHKSLSSLSHGSTSSVRSQLPPTPAASGLNTHHQGELSPHTVFAYLDTSSAL